MILLIHNKADKLIRILYNEEEIVFKGTQCTAALWEMAEAFPDEVIFWCEERFLMDLDLQNWEKIFHHDLILASYAVETDFLPDSIGYIDQLPFININRDVLYPTWRMSTDVGGIRAKVLLKFKELFKRLGDFSLLLNSIAKLGQQNGLLCYSAPQLLKQEKRLFREEAEVRNSVQNISSAPIGKVFAFVYSHYTTSRLFLLFWCFLKYERTFPIYQFFGAFFGEKYFRKEIDLSDIPVQKIGDRSQKESIDVIIPTLGRRVHLLNVLKDLKNQSLLPRRVIVVEQNPDIHSKTDLPELNTSGWPFEVIHHFIHHTGACNARNIALHDIKGDWVFFADDDIRMGADLLKNSLGELKRLRVGCLNINCKQPGEKTVFKKIKQWGSFGSGTSIVKADYCNRLKFDEVFEYGFGEDQDYGRQLRNLGCDIIYHPELEILHLKAPRGGFREVSTVPWEKDSPKPSPTLMAYALKYYNKKQLKGFKTELFLRYYSKQEIKNPLIYLKVMGDRWKVSVAWAQKLREENMSNNL